MEEHTVKRCSGEGRAINRRRFGLMALGVAAAFALRPFNRRDDPVPGWAAAARRIGLHYLRRHPGAARMRPHAVSLPTATVLRQRIAEDFANGRTVEVDGWILSRTELALCLREAAV